MPRPISWIPRLHLIRRAVAGSVRSHWGRQDLEHLFELQPRAAQKLLEMLPSVTIGNARFVERETLSSFLEKMTEASDPSVVIAEYQQSRSPGPRRSLRPLVPRDVEPASLGALPANITLEIGRLEIRFGRLEELAEALAVLAQVLTDDLEEFAHRYEPPLPASSPEQSEEGVLYQKLLQDLKSREQSR
jgi:hypothetical protein